MSAPAPTALSVQQFLTKNGITPRPHPPYSPDLSLSDFLFPWMKKVLKGKCFAYAKEVKQKMAETLHNISELKNCFQQWENVLISVLQQMGSHFGGD